MYGNRIREARKKKGMTLKQVADATGYTIGHISQIERNLKSPSLSALRKIAACLECSEVWLIMGESEQSLLPQSSGESDSRKSYLIRKENRIPMKIPEIDNWAGENPDIASKKEELEVSYVCGKITGLMVRMQPRHWVTEQMISHTTYDESLLLLKGELELHMDNSVYTVHEGDSFYIPSGSLHNYMNRSKEEAVIVVYFSQLVY